MLDGINHPNFHRASRTEYTMSSPGALFLEIIHVGQIAKYIAYDKSLRDGCIPNSLPGIPIGYLQFANISTTVSEFSLEINTDSPHFSLITPVTMFSDPAIPLL